MGVVYNSTTHKYVLITQDGSSWLEVFFLQQVVRQQAHLPMIMFKPKITNVVTPGTGIKLFLSDDDGKPYFISSNQVDALISTLLPLEVSTI